MADALIFGCLNILGVGVEEIVIANFVVAVAGYWPKSCKVCAAVVKVIFNVDLPFLRCSSLFL